MIAIQTHNHTRRYTAPTRQSTHVTQSLNLRKLLIKYTTICANESTAYFGEYFSNFFSIAKYYSHFDTVRLFPNSSNINTTCQTSNSTLACTYDRVTDVISSSFPVMSSFVHKHYVMIATDLISNVPHSNHVTPPFHVDEIAQFLFTKFLKNCMECVITDITPNNVKLMLLPEFIFKDSLSTVGRRFESILTALCHKLGIMAPIVIPAFDISSHCTPQQTPQQQPLHNRVFQSFYPKLRHTNPYPNHQQKYNRSLAQQSRINSIKTNLNQLQTCSHHHPMHHTPHVPSSNRFQSHPHNHRPHHTHHHYHPYHSHGHHQHTHHSFNQLNVHYENILKPYICNKTHRPRPLKYGEAQLLEIERTDVVQQPHSAAPYNSIEYHLEMAEKLMGVRRTSTNPDSEYKRISEKLSHLTLQILKVYRVQNDKLLDDYEHRRQSIKRGLGNDASKLNETVLYHGTNSAVIPKIITQGFLRQFTTRYAFGQGCYFALNPSYSTHPRYAVPNREGIQFVFVCDVICGEYCKGNPTMKVPDVKPNTNNILYETTCNDVANPTVFVTFNDNQAIPRYLIAFRNPKLRNARNV
eukprot:65256_1